MLAAVEMIRRYAMTPRCDTLPRYAFIAARPYRYDDAAAAALMPLLLARGKARALLLLLRVMLYASVIAAAMPARFRYYVLFSAYFRHYHADCLLRHARCHAAYFFFAAITHDDVFRRRRLMPLFLRLIDLAIAAPAAACRYAACAWRSSLQGFSPPLRHDMATKMLLRRCRLC